VPQRKGHRKAVAAVRDRGSSLDACSPPVLLAHHGVG